MFTVLAVWHHLLLSCLQCNPYQNVIMVCDPHQRWSQPDIGASGPRLFKKNRSESVVEADFIPYHHV